MVSFLFVACLNLDLQAQSSFQGRFRESVSEPTPPPTKNKYSPSLPPLPVEENRSDFSRKNFADDSASNRPNRIQVQPDPDQPKRLNPSSGKNADWDQDWDQAPSPPSRGLQEPPRNVSSMNAQWLMPDSPTAESFTQTDDQIRGERIAKPNLMQTPDFDRDLNRNVASERTPVRASHSSEVDFAPSAANQAPKLSTLDPSQPIGDSPNDRMINDPLQDANVQRVSFNESEAQHETNTQSDEFQDEGVNRSPEQAQQLIAKYSLKQNEAQNEAELPGQPTELIQLLRQPIPYNRRAEMVSQYWSTWARWAEFQNASEYVDWLQSISASQSDSALLNVAKSQAENQLLAAKSELSKAQSRLRSFIPLQTHVNGVLPRLPLPADSPLIQKYVTNYQLYRKVRSLPARFQDIDQVLSENLQLIFNQAETVNLARTAAQSSTQSGQGNIGSVLEAGRIWRSTQRELIQSVTSYNQVIADYSLNIADGSHPPETVVAMLIKRADTNAVSPAKTLNASDQRLRAQQAKGTKAQTGFNNGNPSINNANSNANNNANKGPQLSSSFSKNQGNQVNPNSQVNQGAQGRRNNLGTQPQDQFATPGTSANPINNPAIESNGRASSNLGKDQTDQFGGSINASSNRTRQPTEFGSNTDAQGNDNAFGAAKVTNPVGGSPQSSALENNQIFSGSKSENQFNNQPNNQPSNQPQNPPQFNPLGADPNPVKKESVNFNDLDRPQGIGQAIGNQGANSSSLKPLGSNANSPSKPKSEFSTDFSPLPTEKSTEQNREPSRGGQGGQGGQNPSSIFNPSEEKAIPQPPAGNPEDKTAGQGVGDFR